MEMTALLAIALLAVCGWFLKVFEKVRLIPNMTFVLYLQEDVYRFMISVIGTVVLLMLAHEANQLNFVVAVSAGYYGESASRAFRQHTGG